MQEQYHMVCVIINPKLSIHRMSIIVWVFKYTIDSLHNHKYKWNSSHIIWTRYMSIISSKNYLGKIQTAVTRTSRHYILSNKPWSNLHINHHFQSGGCSLFLCRWTLYFRSFGFLVSPFPLIKWQCISKFIMRKK